MDDTGSAGARFHHGNLRTALVAAGEAALEGGADISLRALARDLGVSPAAAYRHFAAKDDLLAAVAGAGADDLAGALRGPSAEKDPQDALLAVAQAYLAFARARPAMFRLMAEGGQAVAALDAALAPGAGAVLGADHPALPAAVLRLGSLAHGLALRDNAAAPFETARLRAVLAPVIAAL